MDNGDFSKFSILDQTHKRGLLVVYFFIPTERLETVQGPLVS